MASASKVIYTMWRLNWSVWHKDQRLEEVKKAAGTDHEQLTLGQIQYSRSPRKYLGNTVMQMESSTKGTRLWYPSRSGHACRLPEKITFESLGQRVNPKVVAYRTSLFRIGSR